MLTDKWSQSRLDLLYIPYTVFGILALRCKKNVMTVQISVENEQNEKICVITNVDAADSRAFFTMSRSASPLSCQTSQPRLLSFELSSSMNLFLFEGLPRNMSLVIVSFMSEVNETLTPFFPFDRRRCVISFVENPSYPSKTTIASPQFFATKAA